MTDALKVVMDHVRSLGWLVDGWDAETKLLDVSKDDRKVAVVVTDRLDRQSLLTLVSSQLDGPLADNPWTAYRGHYVLAKPVDMPKAVMGMIVKAISPSGKYVRFQRDDGGFFWSEASGYVLLEDLGQQVVTERIKPVSRD